MFALNRATLDVSFKISFVIFLLMFSFIRFTTSQSCSQKIKNVVDDHLHSKQMNSHLYLSQMKMVFDRISQEKEFAWKYAELMEKLTQQDKLKTIESLNLPVMTEGVLFYMLDLVQKQLLSQQARLQFVSEGYVSNRQLSYERLISFFCSVIDEGEQQKATLHELSSKRILQIQEVSEDQDELIFVQEQTLEEILSQINHLRNIRNRFQPIHRLTQLENGLKKFFFQNQLNLRNYIQSLGYFKTFIEKQSGPQYLIVQHVVAGCQFCYFKKTSEIAFVGTRNANGSFYEIYYILTELSQSSITNENYIYEKNEGGLNGSLSNGPSLKSQDADQVEVMVDEIIEVEDEEKNNMVKGLLKNITKIEQMPEEKMMKNEEKDMKNQTKTMEKEMVEKQNEKKIVEDKKNQTMKKEDPVSEKKNDTEAKISQSTSTKSTATTTTTNIPRVPTNFNLFSNMIPTINTLPTEQKSVVEQEQTQPQTQEQQIERDFDKYFSTTPNQTVENNKVANTQFAGIGLYHEVPITFLSEQVFIFRGKVLNQTNPLVKTPVSIIFRNSQNNRRVYCDTVLQKGVTLFEIECKMPQGQGQYFLSIFAGQFGRASMNKRKTVRKNEEENFIKTPMQATNAKLLFENNVPILVWDSRYPLVKIVVSQRNQKVEFMFSNYKNMLSFKIKEFGNFKPNTMTKIQVSEASSLTGSASARNSQFSKPKVIEFTALQNHFSESKQSLTINTLPWIVKPGTMIQIKGMSTAPLLNDVLVLTPNQQFISIQIVPNGPSVVRPGIPLNIKLNLTEEGAYILEINHKEGFAVMNRPIYVQQGVPIVPDFQARRPPITNIQAITSVQPATLASKRDVMLKLINELRVSYNVDPVYLDPKLNKLAQDYVEDMVRRGFSGHVNPEGEGPSDRGVKIGITTPIGENLATNPNITDGHYRLSRSNIHLQNSVRPFWTRVGLGFTKNSMGVYIIAQEFSSRDFKVEPLTELQIEVFKQDLITLIIEATQVEKENEDLSKALKEYQASSQQESLTAFLKRNGFNGSKIMNLIIPYNEEIAAILKNGNFFSSSGGRKETGITLRMVEGEKIELFVAFI